MHQHDLHLARVISSRSIGIATFLGGPAAGALLFACNVVLRNQSVFKAMLIMCLGVFLSAWLVYLFLLDSIPGNLSPYILVATAGAVMHFAERSDGEEQELRRELEMKPITAWVILPAFLIGMSVNWIIALPLLMH